MKRTRWIFKVGFGTAALVVGIGWAGEACKGRDCSPERAGQVRCVGDRIETCNDDGSIAYASCAEQCQGNGTKKCWCVFYTKQKQAVCTTKDLWDSQVASSGAMSSSAAGMGGMSASSSSAASGTGGAAMSSSSTGMPSTVNGCTAASAMPATEVDFSGPAYSPNCVKIFAGQTVNFTPMGGASFVSHPLIGGTVDDMGTKSPDGMSPIKPVNMGTAAVGVKFMTAGVYGFYCDVHASSGMKGAVFVQ